MAEATESRMKIMRVALPALIAAIPVALMMNKRRQGNGMGTEGTLLNESNIDLYAAINQAQKHVPGTPVEVELEEEHGIPVWEVEMVPRAGGPNRDVIIDARSGELLEVRADFEEYHSAALEETAA